MVVDFLSHNSVPIIRLENGTWKKHTGIQCVEVVSSNYGKMATPPGYMYSLLANSVLYDKTAQKELFDESISLVSQMFSNNKYDEARILFQSLRDCIPFMKDPSLKDEEEYRIVVKVFNPEDHFPDPFNEKHNTREYLRNIQKYRVVHNMLFPYITIRMNNLKYITDITLGYGNQSPLAYPTMKDFLETLPYHVELKKNDIALRW